MKAVITKTQKQKAENASTRTRLYIHIEGENILENLENRHDRPYEFYRKEVLIQEAVRNLLPNATKFKWSQTAGCRCGCSPGFIVEGTYGLDCWVTIQLTKEESK